MRDAAKKPGATTFEELGGWLSTRRATICAYYVGRSYVVEARAQGVTFTVHGATFSEAIERATRRFDQECGPSSTSRFKTRSDEGPPAVAEKARWIEEPVGLEKMGDAIIAEYERRASEAEAERDALQERLDDSLDLLAESEKSR